MRNGKLEEGSHTKRHIVFNKTRRQVQNNLDIHWHSGVGVSISCLNVASQTVCMLFLLIPGNENDIDRQIEFVTFHLLSQYPFLLLPNIIYFFLSNFKTET